MTASPMPPKAVLEAETDQSFAWAREMRDGMTSPMGDLIRYMADRMAAQVRAEFPEVNTGRLVMAVTDAINALAEALEEAQVTPSLDVLMCIAALAAEQLEREARP